MIKVLEPHPFPALFRETRGLLELPRLVFAISGSGSQPRGHGQPVLLLPGYGAGDGSTAILKSYLRLLGYRVRGWGLGRNSGDVPDLMPRVLKRIGSFARRTQQEVRLIGWSLGGYLAREAARERPDLVHRVITLGTPSSAVQVHGCRSSVSPPRYRHRGDRGRNRIAQSDLAPYTRDGDLLARGCGRRMGGLHRSERYLRGARRSPHDSYRSWVFCGSLQDYRPAARGRCQAVLSIAGR